MNESNFRLYIYILHIELLGLKRRNCKFYSFYVQIKTFVKAVIWIIIF